MSEVIEITQEMISSYAVASRDHNPIHLDEEFAKASGFKVPIAHGMLIMGLASDFILSQFPLKEFSMNSLKSRFRKPVFVGDKISFKIQSSPDQTQPFKVNVEVKNQLNETVVETEAILKLKTILCPN